MKYLAAYMLAKLADKEGTAEDVKAILAASSVEVDDAEVERMLEAVSGKVRCCFLCLGTGEVDGLASCLHRSPRVV